MRRRRPRHRRLLGARAGGRPGDQGAAGALRREQPGHERGDRGLQEGRAAAVRQLQPDPRRAAVHAHRRRGPGGAARSSTRRSRSATRMPRADRRAPRPSSSGSGRPAPSSTPRWPTPSTAASGPRTPPGASYPSLRGETRADLAVVGGGYTGLWTAVRAKQRDPGRRVVLLEGERLGWAASGRNGGFCDASITHGEENGRSRWPDEYDDLARLGRENLDGIVATVAEHGMDVDLERTGELAVAVEPHQVAWLREAAAEGGGTFLDEAAVRAEVDSPTYLAGLLSPDCALLHPAKMVHELARVATELGVEIHEDSAVTGLSSARGGGPVVVSTESGRVVADRVALGTNVVPRAGAPVPRLHRAGVRLRRDDRAADAPSSGRRSGGRTGRGWPTPATSSTTTGSAPTTGCCSAATTRSTAASGCAPSTSTGRRRTGALVSHLLTTFPQLEGVRIGAPVGRRDRHQHAVQRLLRHGARRAGGARRRLHRARRRRDPVRRRRAARPARRASRPSGRRWRWCGACRCRSRPTRWRGSAST